LFAARDHIGVRPLHYAFDGRSLVVASRIGQVLDGAHIERHLNEPLIADFLADNDNPAETVFRDVWRVPAAHVLQHDRGARAPRVWRYWDLQERAPISYRSDGEYAEHFREVARKAVRSRLRGPHPVGIMQSGGYDSSTIACIASELNSAQSSTSRVAAFTAVFDDLHEEDERRYVEALAAHCGFEAHYVVADEMWTFKEATAHAGSWDEPFEGPFDGLIAGLLDRAQQEGVRVLLDGIGGDMLFQGSPYYLFDLFLDRQWRTLSRELKHWPLSNWPALMWSYVLTPLVRRCPPRQARSVPEWMSADFAARCETERRLQAAEPPRRFRRPAQQKTYEAVTWVALPNKMLWLQSEAFQRGIDIRHPILDVRLIDFFMRIPSPQRAQGRRYKTFIHRAMKDSFPQIVADQSLDVGEYLGPLLDRGLLERWDTCLGGRCHVAELGYVDPILLRAAFARYLEHERDYDHARALALVLRLEQWLRYLLGEPD
jgi:asparagine synthase (glutamine-hydrolysing)